MMKMIKMIETINLFLKNNSLSEDEKLSSYLPTTLSKIIDILNNNLDDLYECNIVAHYAGIYCDCVLINYELAEKYYIMAIDNDNINAMNNLAYMYKKQQKYDLAEKYYIMAIENNNINAIYNLAFMYTDQHKYDLA